LGALLSPVINALGHLRNPDGNSYVLSMADFIGLGVLRHLQAMATRQRCCATMTKTNRL
jgi:hypothetical protein